MDSESLKKGLDYRCLNDSYVVLTRDLDTAVKKLRYDEKWWGEYMKTIVHDMDVRYEGIEIGRHEGIEIGIEALIRTCQEFNASKETTKDKLMQQFKLSAEAADEELAKHWK